ncbi:hypothetical protein MVES1_003402 [Malassezia vespertilionis]|uniref:Uncharacterized protein n=1 Tax=Malassezia vespertilionis TaxID=2020962 RepID=A0A2N1J7C6_9BASI|nr:uncharacterized protein MVES1_003402 [Malassezia vespertilionis]PKI82463.1 hypothetical protein MVES_003641 [Malassezia vespertilionis]WFD08033.1 hypothetical protein MVES1_003402 [Malassezia vespertilionis]
MAGGGARGRGGSRSGALGMFQSSGVVYREDATEDSAGSEPVFEAPRADELDIARTQLHILRSQPSSPYWARMPSLNADEQDLPRYTDRYHPDRHAHASTASLLHHAPLHKAIFPPQLFASFTSTETKRMRPVRRMRRNSAAQIDWDNLHMEEKGTGEGEEEAASESDKEELGEYEDEDEDDYAQNYFDNGEDDVDGDDGNGEEAAFD